MYREACTKKYEKVDSFLKRFLSPARHQRVRLIEPCVAVSKEYNKLFKFVVLADDWLYITENPPKLAKDIQGITKIVNITSVELLNDVPEFLGGDLKYRAHHILVTYKRNSDVQTFQDTSAHEAVSEASLLPHTNAAKETNPVNYDADQEHPNVQLSSTLIPQTANKNPTSKNFTKRSTVNTSADTCETNTSGQDVQILGNERSNKSKQGRRLPLLTYNSFESEDGDRNPAVSLHHSCSSLDDLKIKTNARPMRLTASANAADLRAAKNNILNEERLSASGSEPNLICSQKERGLLGSFNGLQRRFRERRSSEKKCSQFSPRRDSKEMEADEKSDEIHLYMLLDATVMLAYLRSTWDNCLLNSVLKQNEKTRSPNSLVKSQANSQSTPVLFDQLRIEIIDSKDIKNTFVLVNELLTACQKNTLVKKLFWQSPELFVFMVQQLKYYNEPCSCNGRNRADELEFIILILECLTEMFRETEQLSMRLTVLKTEKCRILNDLIETTIFSSETKTSKLIEPPEISEAAEVLLTGRPRKKRDPMAKNPQDMELENFSNKLTKCQVSLLHELFIIAYQAAWFPSDDNKSFNISWMVKILESSKTVYRFIQCFVKQVMNLMEMAETGFMSTENTTMMYRLFSVLKTMLQQSTRLHRHIQEYYTEEFRYYVKLHTLTKCLSKDCPLTYSTLKLVEDVTYLIITVSSINSRGTTR